MLLSIKSTHINAHLVGSYLMNSKESYEKPAPPQDFIGPRVFAHKFLPCKECGVDVLIPDKYRRAKVATCLECANRAFNESITK